MRSSSNISVWWPTPGDPYRHFSVAQIDLSDRYFGPLRRAGAISVSAKIVGLVAAIVIAGTAVRLGAVDDTGFVVRVLLGSLVTTVALRCPSVIVDTWFEYRHQRLIENHRAVPKVRFLKVVAGSTAFFGVMVTLTAGGFYFIAQRTDGWPLFAVFAVLTGGGISTAAQFGLFNSGAKGEEELPIAIESELRELAKGFSQDCLGFRVLSNEAPRWSYDLGAAERGLNAFSTGLGQNRRVVLSGSLADEGAETRDFVVGHELVHQAKHHLAIQASVTLLLYLVAVGFIAWFSRWPAPWEQVGIKSTDPMGLPAIALLWLVGSGVLTPLRSWISRGHERIADEVAANVLCPPSVSQSHRIHASTAADLTPPLWARMYATHPTPSERLEFLARLRR